MVSILPGFLTRHWQLKLSAVAMAVLLWTVPRFEAPSRQVLTAPVRVQLNVPEYARLGDPDPAAIQVTLSGPTRELLAVDGAPVWIQIDSVTSMDTTVVLTRSMVRIPPGVEGVEVENLVPGEVAIAFEEIVDRNLTLVAATEGAFPDSLSQAGPIQVSPRVVTVFGPESQVTRLDSIYLVPLDLSQVLSSEGIVLPVDRTGLEEYTLDFSPAVATVRVPVEETYTREIPDLPFVVDSVDSGPQVRSTPSRVTVTLSGARSLVEAVDPSRLRVTPPPGPAAVLTPGQEIQVTPVVQGLPDLVEARVSPNQVTLRRPVG
jgi:YbbR domain-containing protein